MTRIGVAAAPGRARCVVVGGALSPRVLQADPDGARVALVATGALLLGGDEVVIDVVVGPGAWLEVVETAGTVAYPGPPSSWTVRARVGVGGVLVWEGLPFVVAEGADVRRRTRLEMAEGARAVLRETTVLGRAGERGGAVRVRTDVTLAGRDLLVEDLDLTPGSRTGPGVLGAWRVLDVVSAFGFRPGAEAPEHGAAAGPSAGRGHGVAHRMDLAGPGAVVRFLGGQAHLSTVGGAASAWVAEARPSERALAGV